MAQRDILTVGKIYDETRRLSMELEALQDRLLYLQDALPEEWEAVSDVEAEDPWAVWPYCWAIDGWDSSCQWFHSFHGKLIGLRLTYANRRSLRRFARRAELTWPWSGHKANAALFPEDAIAVSDENLRIV
jgi:hypothetical protein